MRKITIFPLLVLITALALSTCAAYYSVFGISSLFSGATLSVAIMATILEISKLVSTSFLFRYWKKCQTFLKTYMLTGVVVLMFITSVGIFGYLTAAYQKSSIQNKILSQKIELIESQKVTYNSELEQYKKKIEFSTQIRNSQEKRLNDALQNESITKNIVQLQEIQSAASDFINKTDNDIIEQNKNIQVTRNSISELDKTIFDLRLQSYQQKDILTFQFVAESLGTNVSVIVKWLIIILIFVFDPLAICLLLAYNTIVYSEDTNVRTETIIKEVIKEVIREVPVEVIREVIKEVPVEVKNEFVPVNIKTDLPIIEPEIKKESFGKKILRKPFGKLYGNKK